MVPTTFLGLLRLFLGTLYPAYASFKAVRTKNVREYVKWMMYWIVFATFTGIETFTDIFVAFWFPFYYELKIFVLIWLISPVSSGSLGSSILYRKFVHPFLVQREDEIDRMMSKFQEQGYNTVTRLGMQAFSYISETVLQTAIRGGGGLVHTLRKSYSLTDLAGHDTADCRRDEEKRPSKAIGMENDNPMDEIDMLEQRRRTGSSGRVRYVRQMTARDYDEDPYVVMRRRGPPRSVENPRDMDEVSSGYSSATANTEYMPVYSETLDTDDYELYNPRMQARQASSVRNPAMNVRQRREVSHLGTLPRSNKAKSGRPRVVSKNVK